jgi:hypothetical protein
MWDRLAAGLWRRSITIPDRWTVWRRRARALAAKR